jgi:hypothetical protein
MTSDGLAAGSRAPLDMVDLAVMAGRSRSGAPMADGGWKRRFQTAYIVAARCGMIGAGRLF